jgi:hypothetical protein
MRNNYWSIGAFADWLRGTPSLKMGTSQQWSVWTKAAKAKHPIRFWLAEEGLSMLQDFVMSPVDAIYNVKYYINNRWITKSHSLTAHPRDIKPGAWRDVGDRFLPCMFNELVDFVEIESAWNHIAWNEEARKKYHPPFWAKGWFRWRTWRCAEAGVEHLEWAAALEYDTSWLPIGHKNIGKPTPQAISAQEILDLYHWWTQDYPNRVDPYDASGWSELCAKRRNGDNDLIFGEDKTSKERAETRRVLNLSNKIEAQQTKEDEDMMIRLIRIRNSLWT